MFADLVAVILDGLHIEGAMFQYRTRRQLQNTLLISKNRNLPDFTALLKMLSFINFLISRKSGANPTDLVVAMVPRLAVHEGRRRTTT
jgi:hypothetical protein